MHFGKSQLLYLYLTFSTTAIQLFKETDFLESPLVCRHPFRLALLVGPSGCFRKVLAHWCEVNSSSAHEPLSYPNSLKPRVRLDRSQVPFFNSSVWPDRDSNPAYQRKCVLYSTRPLLSPPKIVSRHKSFWQFALDKNKSYACFINSNIKQFGPQYQKHTKYVFSHFLTAKNHNNNNSCICKAPKSDMSL